MVAPLSAVDVEAYAARLAIPLEEALERAERLTVFERAKAIETAREETTQAEEAVKRVAQRKRRRRKAPLPAIAAGDRIYLTDVPTPGEALVVLERDQHHAGEGLAHELGRSVVRAVVHHEALKPVARVILPG